MKDAGLMRGDGAEAGKEFRDEERLGALLFKDTFRAAHAGIGFERDFAKPLNDLDPVSAAEFVPHGVGTQASDHGDEQRESKIEAVCSAERSGG